MYPYYKVRRRKTVIFHGSWIEACKVAKSEPGTTVTGTVDRPGRRDSPRIVEEMWEIRRHELAEDLRDDALRLPRAEERAKSLEEYAKSLSRDDAMFVAKSGVVAYKYTPKVIAKTLAGYTGAKNYADILASWKNLEAGLPSSTYGETLWMNRIAEQKARMGGKGESGGA